MKNLEEQIKVLTAETDAITAKIDAEETEKELDTKIENWVKGIVEPIEKKKQEIDKELFILDGIMHQDLPVYKKWETMNTIYLVKIRNKQGRIEVDRLKLDNYGRVDFDTENLQTVTDADYETCDISEWNEGLDKLFKYLSDDK